MRTLWLRPETKFEHWLMVECAVLQAKADLGIIPQAVALAIAQHASFTVDRINELDEKYRHDLIAFVTTVQESLERAGVGEHKERFHEGLTSYDTEDPALVIMLRKGAALVIASLAELEFALRAKADEHRETVMIARTHGQSAEPDTFGHLLLVFAEAVARAKRRIADVVQNDLGEGRIAGAVGTYATVSPNVERRALEILELRPARTSTQILQRDRHAALIASLAIAAATIEQMARTFWQMMRSDVRELEEPRKEDQRGSSAMSHKRNPILTEQLFGLPRLLRGHAQAAIENIATTEWRDISQSSVERHIYPDATSLVHYMATKAAGLVRDLVVFPERMRQNLETGTRGTWASQRVRLALMAHGIAYDDAYTYTQQAAFEAVDQRRSFRTVLESTRISAADPRRIYDVLNVSELDRCFDAQDSLRIGMSHIFEPASALSS
jgi:adenylosuccinate lyase